MGGGAPPTDSRPGLGRVEQDAAAQCGVLLPRRLRLPLQHGGQLPGQGRQVGGAQEGQDGVEALRDPAQHLQLLAHRRHQGRASRAEGGGDSVEARVAGGAGAEAGVQEGHRPLAPRRLSGHTARGV